MVEQGECVRVRTAISRWQLALGPGIVWLSRHGRQTFFGGSQHAADASDSCGGPVLLVELCDAHHGPGIRLPRSLLEGLLSLPGVDGVQLGQTFQRLLPHEERLLSRLLVPKHGAIVKLREYNPRFACGCEGLVTRAERCDLNSAGVAPGLACAGREERTENILRLPGPVGIKVTVP